MSLLTALVLCFTTGVSVLRGQEEGAPVSSDERPEKNLNFLPAPLRYVRCNIRSLEKTGYFRIEDVEFRLRGDSDAVVWTVRIEKSVTCRHIEAMLRDYRDVRFYETISRTPIEIISSLLQYPQRISLGSSNNRLLGQDDVFELWIDLTSTEIRKLKTQRADTLVLRRWRY